MNVFLDSNIYIKNYWGDKPDYEAFFRNFKKAGHRLFIPQLVIDEVINKFEEEFLELQRKYDRLGLQYRPPFMEQHANPNDPIDTFKVFFEKRLNVYGAKVLDYPTTGHSEIAKRSIQTKRPFLKNDRGYRDTLIWLLILDQIKDDTTGEMYVLVTNDGGFNNKNSDALHPDLAQDIKSILGDDEVEHINKVFRIYPNLSSFVNENIKPFLEEQEKLAQDIRQGKSKKINLYDFVSHDLAELISSDNYSPEDIGLPLNFEDISLIFINEIHDLDLDSVKANRIDQQKILISFQAVTNCAFDFFIEKHNLGQLQAIEVWDYDWNKYYAWASINADADLNVSLILDLENGRVESAQADIKIHEGSVF